MNDFIYCVNENTVFDFIKFFPSFLNITQSYLYFELFPVIYDDYSSKLFLQQLLAYVVVCSKNWLILRAFKLG